MTVTIWVKDHPVSTHFPTPEMAAAYAAEHVGEVISVVKDARS